MTPAPASAPIGIIPARAGFTGFDCSGLIQYVDHPRSRGVYSSPTLKRISPRGSSPLARGLRYRQASHPARGEDHPRSRGVYFLSVSHRRVITGSSPLARGLLDLNEEGDKPAGIIPARAGFTYQWVEDNTLGSDHPRSRGVYSRPRCRARRWPGSSPLARGLRRPGGRDRGGRGIIPARAGFTRAAAPHVGHAEDHPRSRGVYAGLWLCVGWVWGSSPLARGLLGWAPAPSGEVGIIPARAGFTRRATSTASRTWDHPRSRGVYTPRP